MAFTKDKIDVTPVDQPIVGRPDATPDCIFEGDRTPGKTTQSKNYIADDRPVPLENPYTPFDLHEEQQYVELKSKLQNTPSMKSTNQ